MRYDVVPMPVSPDLRATLELAAHAEALLLDAMPAEQRERIIALQVRYAREADRALLGL